jgi:hypothetical protein
MKELRMRIGLARIYGALLVAAALPGAASAQTAPRTLAVPATAAWGHAGTSMALPSRVDGLVRTSIADNTTDETDVVTTYLDRDEQLLALVHIYRTGAGDVPLWFDRTVAAIMLPQTGVATPEITAFTRPGASVASGLRASMTDNVQGMRSTAVAIAPLAPGWLVKIRMGSARLEPAALAERLTAFAARLRWPAEAAGARAAVPIEPCPSPLRLRNARLVRVSGGDVLMDALIGSVAGQGVEGPPPVFCREAGATVEWGLYRANRSTDSYLLALNDAGISIGVGDTAALSALMDQGNRRRFSVTLYDRNGTGTYPSFDRLPPPTQVLALVRQGGPVSTTSGNNVTIGADALGR